MLTVLDKRKKISELDKLGKADASNPIQPSKRNSLSYSKMKMAGIIASLEKPTAEYLPQKTIESIKKYIDTGNTRILYSELSSSVYTMSEELVGIAQTNLDSLLSFASNKENNVTDDVNSFIVRLWDHFNLAISQIDNTKNMLASATDKTKDSLYEELSERFKNIEKEYIAILGIFASIVLAFTGGITFSTSVLNNIATVSIYRLAIVVLIIGIVLVNLLFGLFYYINRLVNKEKSIKPLIISNAVLLVLIIAVVFAWYSGTVETRNKKITADSVCQNVTDYETEVTMPTKQIE